MPNTYKYETPQEKLDRENYQILREGYPKLQSALQKVWEYEARKFREEEDARQAKSYFK